MNLTLARFDYAQDGVFGTLRNADSTFELFTLEHSYLGIPKLPTGTYTCVRGMHQLHSMTKPFETFEITGVPEHTGILFHVGNYNADSDGCVLLGARTQTIAGNTRMIVRSRDAFRAFLKAQESFDQFTLEVT